MVSPRHVSYGDITALQPAVTTGTGAAGALGVSVFTGDPEEPTRFRWLDRTITIGRAEHCELVLTDAATSREHTSLRAVDDKIQVTDLGSRNGTYVDGQRIQSITVEAGALVRVGSALLRIARHAHDFVAAESTGPLVGGAALAATQRTVTLVGPTDLAVLVLGETGTGKEVVARLLHAASRRTGPFIPVNCAALPEALVESELFGHTKGAFTGAAQARRGLFAAAAGGTLFLDEVGDLPLAAQAKLLRVLEDKVVRPVGSERDQEVDVRVLSATNRDLVRAVDDGGFRADLLARLSAVEVRLPPLRERPEDLPALAVFLMRRAGQPLLRFEPDALEALALHDWPHNIREFDNTLRAALLGSAGEVTFARLPQRLQDGLRAARQEGPGRRTRAQPTQREEVEAALSQHHGNVRRASEALGLARAHVYRLLERWAIDPKQFRPGSTTPGTSGTESA